MKFSLNIATFVILALVVNSAFAVDPVVAIDVQNIKACDLLTSSEIAQYFPNFNSTAAIQPLNNPYSVSCTWFSKNGIADTPDTFDLLVWSERNASVPSNDYLADYEFYKTAKVMPMDVEKIEPVALGKEALLIYYNDDRVTLLILQPNYSVHLIYRQSPIDRTAADLVKLGTLAMSRLK